MSTTHLTTDVIHIAGPSIIAIERYVADTFEQVPGECTIEVGAVVADPAGPTTVELLVTRDAERYDHPADWLWSALVRPVD